MPGVRLVVQGRVQGVGFRYFVSQRARRLGVAGEVWNRADGAVEVLAHHGDEAVLEEFVTDLSKGPGRVDSVMREPLVGPEPSGFQIGATR